MPLNNSEQKTRRALSKSVAAELRSQAKEAGWKVSQGWLFRDDNGWFVDARPNVWVMERKSTVELRAKPMSIDPIFWEIVGTKDNNKLPLSFRVFGAWTVSTPALTEVEVDEEALDAAGLADLMVQIARCELERSRLDRSLERFLSKVQEHHSRVPSRPHLPAVVCALALLDQREEARAACIAGSAKAIAFLRCRPTATSAD